MKNYNYRVGDLVLIHYWYNDMLTPVKILEKSKGELLVSHNLKESNIYNAPNEKINISEVVDYFRN